MATTIHRAAAASVVAAIGIAAAGLWVYLPSGTRQQAQDTVRTSSVYSGSNSLNGDSSSGKKLTADSRAVAAAKETAPGNVEYRSGPAGEDDAVTFGARGGSTDTVTLITSAVPTESQQDAQASLIRIGGRPEGASAGWPRDATVTIIDRRPSYYQIVFLEDGTFVNLVALTPDVWPELDGWVHAIANKLASNAGTQS